MSYAYLKRTSTKLRLLFFSIVLLCSYSPSFAQNEVIEMSETMEEYIVDNHIESIESMIHKLASSSGFIEQFILEEQHHLIGENRIKRKDISIGEDIDISITHFTEHQVFTMILVPISIYSLAIYDTLLFSAIEVSDNWIDREFPYVDYSNDSIKSAVLSLKNHELLANHLYSEALNIDKHKIGRVKINLKESYVSASTIHEHIGGLSKLEKEQIRNHWNLLQKAFTHDVNFNVELNIYIFGFNDLEVACQSKSGSYTYKITPRNIFQRHHFLEK